MSPPLRDRLRWRLRHHALALALSLLGRPVRCERCGRPLFWAIPLVGKGRLRLLGAEEANVRVAFSDKDRLGFRHLDLDRCPAPERPWVQ